MTYKGWYALKPKKTNYDIAVSHGDYPHPDYDG